MVGSPALYHFLLLSTSKISHARTLASLLSKSSLRVHDELVDFSMSLTYPGACPKRNLFGSKRAHQEGNPQRRSVHGIEKNHSQVCHPRRRESLRGPGVLRSCPCGVGAAHRRGTAGGVAAFG